MKSIGNFATVLGVGLACGGCAKFATNNNGNFTAIPFTFTVKGNINVTAPYIYDVGICASTAVNSPITYAPVPTLSSSNPNGRLPVPRLRLLP